MLNDPGPKDSPLKEAVHETFCYKNDSFNTSIPKYIKKCLGILRRKANHIRKLKGIEELEDIV